MTTPFCVLTRQRSGSLLMIDLLNSHKEIVALRELFISVRHVRNNLEDTGMLKRFFEYNESSKRPFRTINYIRDINEFYNSLESSTNKPKSYGFKLMYNQLLRFPEILIGMILQKYKVIHLTRENHLDVILSRINKDRNGLGHSKVQVKAKLIYLNPSELLKELNRQERHLQFARFMIRLLPFPKLSISYEELSDLTLQKNKELLEFLNVEDVQFKLRSDFKKIARGTYRDKIENYDEIKKLLSGTKHEWLIK